MNFFLSNIQVLIYIFIFFILLCSIGLFFLNISGIKLKDEQNILIFSFSAGTVVISLVLLFTGKIFSYNKNFFYGISLVLCIISLFKVGIILRCFKSFIKDIFSLKNIFIKFVIFLIFVRIIFIFFNIFIPPISWDTLAYHYAIPALYLKAEKIYYIPFMYHSNWPQNMEIFFGYAIGILNDFFANGICFLYAILLLLVIFKFGKEFDNIHTGIIAFALILSTTLFKNDSVNGYVDIGLSFYETAALYAIFLWTKIKEIKFILIAAIAAAGAASVKILGLFSIVFLPLLIIFSDYIFFKRDKQFYLREAIWFLIFSIILACPWYIKSYIDTGNPVWPFAYNIFKGKNWSEELANFRKVYYETHGAGTEIKKIFLLPWYLIESKNMDGYLGNNFIFYYILTPFLILNFIKQKNYNILFLFVYSFLFIIFWFFSAQMIRFLFPGFVIITIIFSYMASKIIFEYKNTIIKFLIVGYFLFLIFYSFPFRKKSDYDGIKLFLGVKNREEFLEKKLDNYKLIKKINEMKEISGKIVLLKEIRGYYLEKDYIWGDPVNQGIISYKTKIKTLQEFKNNDIKYILLNNNQYNNAEKDGYTENTYKIINEIIQNNAKMIINENNVYFYEIIY